MTVRVLRQQREALNGHRGAVVYMTGLSGAGKSTLAALVEQQLHAWRLRTYLLDGDELRQGMNRDLGFSPPDRSENARRVAELSRLMVDAGLLVLVALISPFRADREAARARFAADEFLEVFVDAPLDVCERRDPKGLYQRARQRQITGFTGIDSPYEEPLAPDLRIDAANTAPADGARAVLALMARRGWLPRHGHADVEEPRSVRP